MSKCRNLIILLLCSFILFGCTSSQLGSKGNIIDANAGELSTEKLLNSGFVQIASGNIAMARMFFNRAVSKDQKSAMAFIGLGDCDYNEGVYEKAFANYQQASLLAPQNVRAIIGKARAMRQQNKLNAAISEINAAMSIEPNNLKVLTELAILYDLLGKESLSAPIYQEILERVPDQAFSNNNIGLNFLANNKYDKAIIAFERALSLDGNNDRIKNNLATAYALYGNEQMAVNIFKDTVGEAGAYNNLGYLYLTQGRIRDAETALHKALEINPKYYQKARENLDRLEYLKKARQ